MPNQHENNDVMISVRNVGKMYRLFDQPKDRLKEQLFWRFGKTYSREFWALQDISFEVNKGEVLGIIGKNGSGKSTLLQIIVGTLTPTTGDMQINGRVAALLELGSGFNPEFTGRENVYLNGSILGFNREEMDNLFDEIAAFAEIGQFMDQPVKHYSSGMYMRLAFAVAISVDPDILVLDEALAVGDIRFQQKCYRKIKEFSEKGTTILLVSHDMGAVISFCSQALWLKDGQIFQKGISEEVCRDYTSYMSYDALPTGNSENHKSPLGKNSGELPLEWEDVIGCSSFGDKGASILRVSLYSLSPWQKIKILKGGEKVKLFMEVEIHVDIMMPIFGFIVKDRYGNAIFGINNYVYGIEISPLTRGKKPVVEFEFEFPKLKNGPYSISVAIAEGTQANHIQHHWVHDAYVFQIIDSGLKSMQDYFLVLEWSRVCLKEMN